MGEGLRVGKREVFWVGIRERAMAGKRGKGRGGKG